MTGGAQVRWRCERGKSTDVPKLVSDERESSDNSFSFLLNPPTVTLQTELKVTCQSGRPQPRLS